MLDSATLVAAGAVCGALTRWRVTTSRQQPTYFTTANVSGSFALGLAAGRFADSRHVLLACGTGFLGSYTTFSTFSLDTILLIEQGLFARATCLALGTPALGISAAAAGLSLGRRLLKSRGGTHHNK